MLAETIRSSPVLQYHMELEIAGLVDRPNVDIPVSEKLQRLHDYQDRLKNIKSEICNAHSYDTCSGSTRYIGDLVISLERSDGSNESHVEGAGGQVFPYDTVKIGHVNPIASNQSTINWWNFRLPHPASIFDADLGKNYLLVYLQDHAVDENLEFKP